MQRQIGRRNGYATVPDRVQKGSPVSFIVVEDVVKEYHTGEVLVRAADGVSFSIEKGELAVVVGPSGAGKSTVLNILGGMDTCDSGRVLVDDTDVAALDQRGLTLYRRNDIGFVFQFYNLIPNLTALENVELAAQICKDPLDAEDVLREVGLGQREGNFPAQLSGGEQQRVAIARALAKNPKLLLCDEPTGALDYTTGKVVLSLLQDACRNRGMTVVIITHNLALTPMADRVIHIRNGKAESIELNPDPISVETIEW
ncbi:MAG: ABC transporter ATP-binding protein [Coriobacteriaceae bacterium]|nr:ABC transporter ATP-binding protein [Coriobacteriaceae bacterium]